jgi:hypothetical protein
MGLAQPPARSTLADALNIRDWRIYQALALRLISRARALYAQDSMLDIDATIYALDATTVDLCLSLFEWAPFALLARPSSYTPYWICAAPFLPFFTSVMAS